MIGERRLIDPVGVPADQHEAPVAIAAIDIAMLVDLQENARVAKRGTTGNIGRTITGNTAMGDAEGFGRGDHEVAR